MARILVIDDSRIARLMMRRHLEGEGHDVTEAEDGAIGLQKLTETDFDVATCDVLMPIMSGIEVLAGAKERRLKTPVIVATADIQKTTREACQENGAWAIISKPVDMTELTELIQKVPKNQTRLEMTSEQIDGLSELINIGVGRAAASLNDLVDGHVELEVPMIDLVELKNLEGALTGLGSSPLSSVQLGFEGGLDGNAFLVFPEASALQLVEILVGSESVDGDLDGLQAATLNEVGNIVISAVMGTLSNVLERSLQYSLPVYEHEPILDILAVHSTGNPIVLIAKTSFVVQRSLEIQGHLLLLFELTSLDALIDSIQH